MMTASHIVLEAMKKRHVRAVRSIDKQVYSQPWSTSIYHEELRRRDKRVYYVAYHEGQIAGYGGAMIVHDEGHITSIAVHPEAQGLGIAKRLLEISLAFWQYFLRVSLIKFAFSFLGLSSVK